jgi:hypothetical protein
VRSITPPWAGCSGLMHLNHLGALCGSYTCVARPRLRFCQAPGQPPLLLPPSIPSAAESPCLSDFPLTHAHEHTHTRTHTYRTPGASTACLLELADSLSNGLLFPLPRHKATVVATTTHNQATPQQAHDNAATPPPPLRTLGTPTYTEHNSSSSSHGAAAVFAAATASVRGAS